MEKYLFSTPKETKVEDYLRDQVRALGGKAYKFTSPMQNSVPDRLCLLPNAVLVFVEVKKPDGSLTDNQKAELKFIREMGQWATTVWCLADVDHLIGEIKTKLNSQAA